MNFQNLSFDYVEPLQPPPAAHIRAAPASHEQTSPRSSAHSSDATVRPHDEDDLDDLEHPDVEYNYYGDRMPASLRPATPSTIPKISPYNTTTSSSSPLELYGTDRLFGPPFTLPENDRSYLRDGPRFTVDEIHSIALQQAIAGQLGAGMGFKDQLALEASRIDTPGVDDTPYIQAALEVLTRDRSTGMFGSHASSSSGGSNPFNHLIPDRGLGYYAPPSHPLAEEPSLPQRTHGFPAQGYRDPRDYGRRKSDQEKAPLAAVANRPSQRSSVATLVPSPKKPSAFKPAPKDAWRAVDQSKFDANARSFYPPPTFVPTILRPASMLTLTILCLFMIIALIFSAAFSQVRNGLVGYVGTIYSAQYFVFRILPPLLAMVIQLYTHAVVMTCFRILPFAQMDAASYPEPSQRYGSIFQDLYPRSFLLPHLVGPVQVCVPLFVIWVMNIAVPLQCALFDIVLADGQWRWATVSGIAYVLAVLYLALAAAVITLMLYWRNRQTGLIWDPRSIADFAALGVHSKIGEDYSGTDRCHTREEMKVALSKRMVDRLSYWAWRDQRDAEVWVGMSSTPNDADWLDDLPPPTKWSLFRKIPDHSTSPDLEAQKLGTTPSSQAHGTYLPASLRTLPLAVFTTFSLAILLTLFLLCFLPQTAVRMGFPPRVDPVPSVPGAFSAANFLYAFLPALLAQVLYLLFLPLDLALRILTPWGEMTRSSAATFDNDRYSGGSPRGGLRLGPGAAAEKSILADYAACALPWEVPLRAFRNGHYHLALTSALSALFALLPILAGALFTALTTPDGTVRMFPSVPILGLVLALLTLYTLSLTLTLLLPSRHLLTLPHDVSCIAEILSFLATPELVADPVWKGRSGQSILVKGILVERLVEGGANWRLGIKGGRYGVRPYVRRVVEKGEGMGLGKSREMRRAWEGSMRGREERRVVEAVEGTN